MDASQNDLLGELAADAALERSDFLITATEQLRKFLDTNGERIRTLGGLTLIDDDPDFLSIAPDLTFRSRSRFLDEDTGEWTSDTEVIESAAELVELYNPADIYAAFAEAAREAAGLAPSPTAAGDLLDVAGISASEAVALPGGDLYAEAADTWAANQEPPSDEEAAARRLYDLALSFQERSQSTEARLIEDFEVAAARLTSTLGDFIIVDDEDERLTLEASGGFRAEVVAEELVEFYDPTDVFGDLADALAEAYPALAPEYEETEGDEGDEGRAEGDEDEEDVEDVEDAEDADAEGPDHA